MKVDMIKKNILEKYFPNLGNKHFVKVLLSLFQKKNLDVPEILKIIIIILVLMSITFRALAHLVFCIVEIIQLIWGKERAVYIFKDAIYISRFDGKTTFYKK